MRKVFIFCLIGLFPLAFYGQRKIKITSCDCPEKIKINKLKSSSANDRSSNLIYSKNNRNAVDIDICSDDLNKPDKDKTEIINLYDNGGNLLASSNPIDLYDWDVIPMGDDKTVLVIFPAGTAQAAVIKFLKVSGKSLIETNEITRETADFSLCTDSRGEKLITYYKPVDCNNLPQLTLFDNCGTELWTTTVDEKYIYTLEISDNYIMVSSHDVDNRIGYLYVFDISGKRKMKAKIGNIEGTYQIECSSDEMNRYFAISCSNEIVLFDSKTFTKVKSLRTKDSHSMFVSYVIDSKGNIVAVSKNEIIVGILGDQNIEMKFNLIGISAIEKINDGIILNVIDNKRLKCYEVQY